MLFRVSTGDKRPQHSPRNLSRRKRLADQTTGESLGNDGSEDDSGAFSVRFNLLRTLSSTTAEMEKPSSSEPISCVQKHLSASCHTEFALFHHLQHILRKDEGTVTALGDVFRRRNEITAVNLFSLDSDVMVESDSISSCEVFEVGEGGVVTAQHDEPIAENDGVLYSAAIWNIIKDVNTDNDAVGRITILQRPCPATFASIHFTMREHFDMNELLSHIVSNKVNKGKTTPCMLRAFEPEQIHQRTFFFVFKYYTIVDEGLAPAPWQCHDSGQEDRESTGHIDISECSSVVALSLEAAAPIGQVPLRRGHGKGTKMGAVYDTFAPFHILNIRLFPDNVHSEHDFGQNPCYNGPHAFLECLTVEYRAAIQRLSQLGERIEEMVIPSNKFVFDLKLRDKLLFEDADFTFSRRYFWAYNTLDTVNDSIRSMIGAYHDTFNHDFWLGKHPALWPHQEPESEEGRNYLDQLGHLRHELEWCMIGLKALMKSNEQLREKIESFREQLYSGSSVKNNRTAIEQGENIKILTGVSMLFLPLTFVTSVFGMQMFNISPSDWRFIVIMITVCVPFFILIFVLQTHAGMSIYKRIRVSIGKYLDSWKKHSRTRREKRSQLQHAAMIRKQSSASAVFPGRRESLWNLISDRKDTLLADGKVGAKWWRRKRAVAHDSNV